MTTETDWSVLEQSLSRLDAAGKGVRFWWRDDDAIEATSQLDRLLDLSNRFEVPVLLAVIPCDSEQSLANRIDGEALAVPAVHGFAHVNHASADEKKQELGDHRPADHVLAELFEGRRILESLFGEKLSPVLVPPWNRISPEIVSRLPEKGFKGLSCFGAEDEITPVDGLAIHNTHVDVIDWRGSRGLTSESILLEQVSKEIDRYAASDDALPIGLLTHHLVHDGHVWTFIEELIDRISRHDACKWVSPSELFGY